MAEDPDLAAPRRSTTRPFLWQEASPRRVPSSSESVGGYEPGKRTLNRVNGLVFNEIIAHLHDAIRKLQDVQRRDRSTDVRLVPGPDFGARAETSLRDVWRRDLPDVPFAVEQVARIDPRPGGKRRVVVVER